MRGLARPAVLTAVSLLAVACSSILSPSAPHRASPQFAASKGCAHLSKHQYEVCYAYIVNDSLLARLPYYKFGRQPGLGSQALTRLESRYYGDARHFLIDQTRKWPREVDVSVPSIRIVGSVRVSSNLTTATLTTVESWLVRAEPGPGKSAGRVLFAETSARHTISLRRTPTILCLLGHCLHKWVVVRIQ
jgi:hypothetical protein